MKKYLTLFIAAAALVFAGVSCKKESTLMYSALATMTSAASGVEFQIDDSTVAYPTNLKPEAYGNKVLRSLISYTVEDGVNVKTSRKYNITLYTLDTLLTKLPAPDLGTSNPSVYGSDPLEITTDWTTLGEDGYLTLTVATNISGSTGSKHVINLVDLGVKDGKHCYELRHNANGDSGIYSVASPVAFNLNSIAPADRKAISVNVKWQGFSAEKNTDFKLTFRKK